MLSLVLPAAISGLATGAIYALVALGLTLIYGVLHIINFAHGSLLMVALYAVFFLHQRFGLDPYAALPLIVAVFFGLGYALQRFVVNPCSHGKDGNILLVTLAIAIIVDNLALYFFTSNTRTIDVAYAGEMVEIGPAFVPLPRVIAFVASIAFAGLLWLVLTRRPDSGWRSGRSRWKSAAPN